jgi:FkbM family methyltransferase
VIPLGSRRHLALRRARRALDLIGVPSSVTGRVARLFRPTGGDAEGVPFDVGGVRLWAPRRFVANYVGREYEPGLTRLLRETLREGAVVIDAGAHVGYLSILMAREVGAAGRVFAIEPSLENVDFLRRNLAANQVTNVSVLPVALTSRPGLVSFHLNESSDSYGLFDHPNTPTTSIEIVPAMSLDALFGGFDLDRLDLIKIDTEGAEIEVLQGMVWLRERFPVTPIVVEWFPAAYVNRGLDGDALPRHLESLGLSLDVLDPSGGGPGTVAAAAQELAERRLPTHWYCNLVARPSS